MSDTSQPAVGESANLTAHVGKHDYGYAWKVLREEEKRLTALVTETTEDVKKAEATLRERRRWLEIWTEEQAKVRAALAVLRRTPTSATGGPT